MVRVDSEKVQIKLHCVSEKRTFLADRMGRLDFESF